MELRTKVLRNRVFLGELMAARSLLGNLYRFNLAFLIATCQHFDICMLGNCIRPTAIRDRSQHLLSYFASEK